MLHVGKILLLFLILYVLPFKLLLMDSKIKTKFGTLIKIGNWMLLLWITRCPPIFVCMSLLMLPIRQEL